MTRWLASSGARRCSQGGPPDLRAPTAARKRLLIGSRRGRAGPAPTHCLGGQWVMSRPSNSIFRPRPAGKLVRPMTAAVVDLLEPDSPTMATGLAGLVGVRAAHGGDDAGRGGR